jgi:hypothetical protein
MIPLIKYDSNWHLGTALLWRQLCGSISIKLVSQYFVFCMRGKWCPEWGATWVLRKACFLKPRKEKELPLILLGTTGTRCLWQNESKTFQTCPILMLCPFTFFPFHSDASLFCFIMGPSLSCSQTVHKEQLHALLHSAGYKMVERSYWFS